MQDQDTRIIHHAILIGINDYPEDPLKYCVRDVEAIAECLRKSLSSVNIQILSAPLLGSKEGSPHSHANVVWPTHNNVVSTFRKVTACAQPGDFVFLHYSGHGTVVAPTTKYSNPATGDLALILLAGEDTTDVRYLYSQEIASLLFEMVDKKLVVTFVIDSCFSGSISREHEPARYMPYRNEVAEAYPPTMIRDWGTSPNRTTDSGYRDATMHPSWLIDPDGYTILAAAGPIEKAYENHELQHGMLTSCLLSAFTAMGGVGGRMAQIYQHVRFKVEQSRWQKKKPQHPALYGNQRALFFGCRTASTCPGVIAIIKTLSTDTSRIILTLQAGIAHGISMDDQFELRPMGSHGNIAQDSVPIAKVCRVGQLTSLLEVGEEGWAEHIDTGWLAYALTRLRLREYAVAFANSSIGNDSVCKGTVEGRQSLNIRSGIYRDTDKSSVALIVKRVGEDYEISDSLGHVLASVAMLTDTEGDAHGILNAIQHITCFKLVRELRNESRGEEIERFRNSFCVHIVRKGVLEPTRYLPGCWATGEMTATCLHPECRIEMGHGEKCEITVENLNSRRGPVLYVHVYGMGSRWQVENMLRANHEVVPPRGKSQDDDDYPQGTSGKWTKTKKMIVPEVSIQTGDYTCEDTVKVFITEQSTSFVSLELPKLGTLASSSGPRQLPIYRGGRVSDNWIALNFRMITTYKPDT